MRVGEASGLDRAIHAQQMKPWQKTLLISVFEIVGLIVLHAALKHVVAERDIVSRIFAAGSHVPKGTLLLAGAFLGSRFLALLVLPGIIVARIALVVMDARGVTAPPKE